MELFQELLFTISFSLIVSLLIAKLFSLSSTSDDGNSTVSIRFEEKIEKEWVVCDAEKEENPVCVKDPVEVTEEVGFDHVEAELGSGVVIKAAESESSDGGVDDYKVFDESPERTEFNDAGVGSVETGKGDVVDSGVSLIQGDFEESVKGANRESSAIDVVGEGKVSEEDDLIVDDDWQGVETTELEKRFGAAVAFVDSKRSVDRVNLIDNEVKIELYGLHKVAIEGSCFEPQPMALKVSARANWNSWKRLENLGREDAMERYITLLSQYVPDWMGSHVSETQ